MYIMSRNLTHTSRRGHFEVCLLVPLCGVIRMARDWFPFTGERGKSEQFKRDVDDEELA